MPLSVEEYLYIRICYNQIVSPSPYCNPFVSKACPASPMVMRTGCWRRSPGWLSTMRFPCSLCHYLMCVEGVRFIFKLWLKKTPYNSMPICSIAYKPIIARWCTMMHLTSCFATGLEKQGKNTSKLLDLWPERWRKWYTTAKVFRDVMDCEGDIWRLHCEGRARTQSPLICKTSFWLPPAEGAKIIWRWDPALLH